MGMIIYFFKYNLNDPGRYPLFVGGTLLFSVFGAIVAPVLVKRIGKKSTFQISNILTILCSLALFLISVGKETYELSVLWRIGGPCFFLFLMAGFFSNIAPVICTAIMADSVDYGEWLTGQRTQGLISAVFMTGNKAGMALGGVLIGLGLSFIGYVPNLLQYPAETLTGILLLSTIVPFGCRILMSVLMWFYDLSDSRFEEIVRELNESRASKAKN